MGRPWEALEEKHGKRPPALPRGGRGRQPEARTKAVLDLHQRRLYYQRRGRGPASCLATLQRRGGVGVKGGAWTRSIPIPEMSTCDGPQALQLNYPKPHPASDPDCKPCGHQLQLLLSVQKSLWVWRANFLFSINCPVGTSKSFNQVGR